MIVRGNGSYFAFTKEKRDATFRNPEKCKKKKKGGGTQNNVNIDKANPVV